MIIDLNFEALRFTRRYDKLDTKEAEIYTIISSLKDKNYIQIILKYKKDSKEIEQRKIIPIVQMNNGYSQNKQESICTETIHQVKTNHILLVKIIKI